MPIGRCGMRSKCGIIVSTTSGSSISAGEHHVAIVVADTAGKWPVIEELTSEFMYARLHGEEELYVSGYTAEAIETWKRRIEKWRDSGRDVFVYFDNDVKVRSPFDAMQLAARVAGR